MGNYWAEIADKNQTEKQLKFLKNQLKKDGYVLDLACGTGRHSIPLSMDGYSMVCLDVSANLLNIAKQRRRQLQLVRGDMRFLPFKHQTFAAVISIDTSFGYLQSAQDDAISLLDLRRVLGARGDVVVDVFNREQLMIKYQSKNKGLKWALLPFLLKLHSQRLLFRLFKWKEYPSFFLLQERTVIQSGERLCDLWVVCDKSTGKIVVFEHVARLYMRSELEDLLKKAGFAVNEVYGGYEGENFSSNSLRLILVANANEI
jgi:ubiquinone/menaquinone biosynthesis C-methylase UbiE